MTLQHIAVIGAGTMGSGIAQTCAAAGHTLLLIDINEQALGRGLQIVQKNLDRQVEKGTLPPRKPSRPCNVSIPRPITPTWMKWT